VVGLFNQSGATQVISTSVSALGMKAGQDYLLTDLWTHRRTQGTGAISAEVPSHGVALFRMRPLRNPAAAPPAVLSNPSLAGPLAGGQAVTAARLPRLPVRSRGRRTAGRRS